MLREGTTTRSSLEIADQTAFLGISLATGITWDATSVALHTPTGQLDSALALFADVALRPSFPANEFDRLKKNRLTEILQIKDRGPSIANQAYASILYGSQHPYGTLMAGTQQTVEGLSVADLKAYYASEFKPNNATLIVVGDVKPADIERRVRALFGGWQRGPIQERTYPTPPAAGQTTIFLIDKPGAPQSSFRIGSVGVPRSTKDFFALSVLNTILGGSFTSRLNNTLREVKGYTYGAGSSFDMRKMAGPFTASSEVVAAKTDSALLVFMNELNSIRQPVPADEILRAKRYTQLRLPWSFETSQQIAGGLVPIVLYDLPADFFSTYVQNIEAVTQADIQRVANQYINPSTLAIVIVGDRKTIESGLKATNVGAISVRDINGQPIQQ
jgi:predicted Zn-dependent peptidase